MTAPDPSPAAEQRATIPAVWWDPDAAELVVQPVLTGWRDGVHAELGGRPARWATGEPPERAVPLYPLPEPVEEFNGWHVVQDDDRDSSLFGISKWESEAEQRAIETAEKLRGYGQPCHVERMYVTRVGCPRCTHVERTLHDDLNRALDAITRVLNLTDQHVVLTARQIRGALHGAPTQPAPSPPAPDAGTTTGGDPTCTP